MSAPLIYFGNGPDCTGGCGCGAPPTPMLRVAGFVSSINTGGDYSKMLAWLHAVDFDNITVGGYTGPIPWGYNYSGVFTSYSQTSPVSVTLTAGNAGGNGSINNLDGISGSNGACVIGHTSDPGAFRAQAYLPTQTEFAILASGPGAICGGGPDYWIAQGCTYNDTTPGDFPMIVDLPIPDDDLDNPTGTPNAIFVQNYSIVLIGGSIWPPVPLVGSGFVTLPSLTSLKAYYDAAYPSGTDGYDGTGPNWNPSATCADTISPLTADPFGGTDP